MISMTGHFYSKENVDAHRKRIDDAAAKRLSDARVKVACTCGASIRFKYLEQHCLTDRHKIGLNTKPQ